MSNMNIKRMAQDITPGTILSDGAVVEYVSIYDTGNLVRIDFVDDEPAYFPLFYYLTVQENN